MIYRVEDVVSGYRLVCLATVGICWVVPSAALVATFATSPDAPQDFRVFMASGRQLTLGLSPYATASGMNMNAPASLPLFHAVASLNLPAPSLAWSAASGLVYLACLLLLPRAYPRRASLPFVVWALAQSAIWSTLALGQIYVVLLAPVAAALFLHSRGRPILAALLIGPIVAVKPNFALWPLLLLLADYRKEVVAAAGSSLCFAAVPMALYGPGVYVEWLAGVQARTPLELAHHANASLPSLATRAGVPMLGLIVALGLVAAIAWWAWRRRPLFSDIGMAALAAATIASPVAWLGYAVILLPAFFRPWNRWLWLAAIALLFPWWLAILSTGPVRMVWELTHPAIFLCVLIGTMIRKSPT